MSDEVRHTINECAECGHSLALHTVGDFVGMCWHEAQDDENACGCKDFRSADLGGGCDRAAGAARASRRKEQP